MFSGLVNRYRQSNIVGRLVFINVAVYVLCLLIGVFGVLYNSPSTARELVSWFELPASPALLLERPWTLFTYMFMHAGLFHILWNMLALYLFGKIFLNFFSIRHFIGVYIWGGLAGALFFVAAYNVFPYFAPFVPNAALVGASASVLAVVVAAAVRSPGYRINMLFIGSVKLSTFAAVMVLVSFLLLSGDNAGGNFAHLGGAFAGWLLALLLGRGFDLASAVLKPYDWVLAISRWLKEGRKKKKGNFSYKKNRRAADYEYNARKKADEAEIDRLLEKIKKGGYASLSDEEKKRLFDASSK